MKNILCSLILGLSLLAPTAHALEVVIEVYPPLHGWVCNSEASAVRFTRMLNSGKKEADIAEAINAEKKPDYHCNNHKFYAAPPEVTYGTSDGIRYELRTYEVIGDIRDSDGALVRYIPGLTYYVCKFISTGNG